jgi:hypothetical protein
MTYCTHITTSGYWCKRRATTRVHGHWYCTQHAKDPDAGKVYPPTSKKGSVR